MREFLLKMIGKYTGWMKGRVCNHWFYKTGTYVALGKEKEYSLSGEEPLEYCPTCMAQNAIPCAWCGNPILHGEPITLFNRKKGEPVRKGAVKFSDASDSWVGCSDPDCALTAAMYAGYYLVLPDGRRVIDTGHPTYYSMREDGVWEEHLTTVGNPENYFYIKE